jgi:predicted phage terminase large subunit-like protein
MTPERAATELLRRTDAQTGLISFTEYTFERYRTAPHHRIIAEQLERVERGEVDRLMLLVPPRHGKSELASKRFPAFYLGRQSHKQFLSVSASAELASDFGRDVRNIIISPEYRSLFDTRLAEDSQAKGKWHTSAGGVYYSIGIGGHVMGRGGDVILIDDPYSTMEDAQSETTRKTVWDWYNGTAYNRLMPGGAIVVINHRMHEEDLSGRLLAQQVAGGDKWTVVELPALSEDGEALWPEAYPPEALARIKNNTFGRYWSALYQQNPAPDEGTYFKREWFKRFKLADKPKDLHLYGTSDYAVTEDGGDWTVHRAWGVDPLGDLYCLAGWRGQTSSDKWIERQIDLIAEHKPHCWFGEGGVIAKAIEPMLRRRMVERRIMCRLEWIPSIADKPTRARGFQARAAMGKVHIIEGPEGDAIVDEYLRFPAGKHDDEVDAGSLIGRALDEVHPAIIKRAIVNPNPADLDRWRRGDMRIDTSGISY